MQKALPKEKVVQIYEKLFLGQDVTQGRSDFWDEFFLLKVNIKAILLFFNRLSYDQLVNLRPHLNRLYEECMAQAKNSSHWLRVANALMTADCLVVGVYSYKDVPFTITNNMDLLIADDNLLDAKNDYVNICTHSFIDSAPFLLQEIVLNSMMLRIVASDNFHENPFSDWLLCDGIFDILTLWINSQSLGYSFRVNTCCLLGLLAFYNPEKMKNPFLFNLSRIDDAVLLNNISSIISFALSESNRKYSDELPASGGVFASFASLLGALKPGDSNKHTYDLHDGLLLCLYAIILHNRDSPTLLTCSHAHFESNIPSDINYSTLTYPFDSNNNTRIADSIVENSPVLASNPRNLLADLIEYTSVIMQGISSKNTLNTCELCFKLISEITKNSSVCSFLHEYNIHFAISLHKANLRHRKPAALLQDRSYTNTMAAILMDLVKEFLSTHLMKSFPYQIYSNALDICFFLLSHQKDHNIHIEYDWRQLWKALFDLAHFIVKIGSPSPCTQSLIILQKTVGIFNFFITFGDSFLQGPSVYDELYYELMRMTSIVESILKFGQHHSVSSDLELRSLATELIEEVDNMHTTVKHFEVKLSDFTSKSNLATLTENQVLDVIRENYDALTLKVDENLHMYFGESSKTEIHSMKDLLSGISQRLKKSCLDTAAVYQSRFSELSLIN